MTISSLFVVVGSVNADMYVEVQRLPIEGETIAAPSGQVFPGGKGANEAACAARLIQPTSAVKYYTVPCSRLIDVIASR